MEYIYMEYIYIWNIYIWNIWIYPLVICDIAIEHGPVEIVDLPTKNGDYSNSFVSLLGRVYFRRYM